MADSSTKNFKALCVPLGLAAALAPAFAAEPVSLNSINVGADTVEFHFSGPARENVRFEPAPPRLLIDWSGVTLKAAVKMVEGRGAVLARVRAGELDPGPAVRCVVELKSYAVFGIIWEGNVMSLVLGDQARSTRTLGGDEKAPAPARGVVKRSGPQSSSLPPPSLGKAVGAPAKPEAAAPAKPAAKPEPEKSSAKPAPAAKPEPEKSSAKPAPAAKPEPEKAAAKPSAAGGRFFIQLGSFGDEARAKALKAAVESAVSPVAVVPSGEPAGKPLFRVEAGPFADRASADEALKKLKGLGHAGAFVRARK